MLAVVMIQSGKWQPTPAFVPGEFCGQRNLVGCYSPWGCKRVRQELAHSHACVVMILTGQCGGDCPYLVQKYWK